jgi:hypothetical protein
MQKLNQDFDNYVHCFIQRYPSYATKLKGKGWKTKNKPLSDIPIKAHLAGRYDVAVVGKWYPPASILDIDKRQRETVEEIKDILSLDESNSMLCRSESPDSYHLLIKPSYNGKPPTLRLLNDAFSNFVKSHGIEIYPQQRQKVRLPFGHGQNCLDPIYSSLNSWQDQLHEFEKLDEFNLSAIPMRQQSFDFKSIKTAPHNFERFRWYEQGKELLECGLQSRSSRHHSQWKIIYYLWRINTDQSDAERIVWFWIRSKHNDFSNQIIDNPSSVEAEIKNQADWLYSKYEFANIFPDSTHNSFHGYICKRDLRDIIQLTSGSFPKMKFLYHLVKFSNPRRHRRFIDIHTDKLIEWASKDSYLKRINEASEKRILKRYGSYLVGRCAKSFKISWPWRGSSEAVLYDGRSIDTLKGTLKNVYEADELRQLLLASGATKQATYEAIKCTFEE